MQFLASRPGPGLNLWAEEIAWDDSRLEAKLLEVTVSLAQSQIYSVAEPFS